MNERSAVTHRVVEAAIFAPSRVDWLPERAYVLSGEAAAFAHGGAGSGSGVAEASRPLPTDPEAAIGVMEGLVGELDLSPARAPRLAHAQALVCNPFANRASSELKTVFSSGFPMRPGRLELPPRLHGTRPSTLRVYQFRHRRVAGRL
jgi:hypothetical protein